MTTNKTTVTYTISSIDGRFDVTHDELVAGVSTNWSDVSRMPVFGDDGECIGYVDPTTGTFEDA